MRPLYPLLTLLLALALPARAETAGAKIGGAKIGGAETAGAEIGGAEIAKTAISGQSDPAFQTALEQWLKGNEARALPALGALAAQGNRAAQVLVGLIDVTPRLHGPWLGQKSRAERMALLRAPATQATGQLSGVNWLRLAAEDTPLAAAWVRLWDGASGPQVMLDLVRLGEPSAARTAARRLALRGTKGFAALADDPDFPGFALPLAIRDWQATDPARAAAALAALPAADPGRALLGRHDPTPDEVMAFARTDAALGMLNRWLVTLCPDPPGDTGARPLRLARALTAIGGWGGLAELGPPSETLVDPDRWTRSTVALQALAFALPPPHRLGDAANDRCLLFLSGLAEADRRAKPLAAP